MQIVIEIPENKYDLVKLSAMSGVGDFLHKAVANGTPLPGNVTNGDMVEKFFGKDVYFTLIRMMYSSCCEKLKKWWDAPYRKWFFEKVVQYMRSRGEGQL